MAIFPAAMAYWQKRSNRRASFLSIKAAGSNPFTSAATEILLSPVSKRVTGPMPTFPAFMASHVSSTHRPRGVTAPMPVITTRCVIVISPSLPG